MEIMLIAPASGKWQHVGTGLLYNGRTFRFSMLSLLSVAAASPLDARIRIVDEQVEAVPLNARPDLVGITCMTALAPRAYELADQFRARGVPVVLGGMHPSLCPEEALTHATAVVAGEAEGVWPEVVAAAAAGRLGGIYRSPAPDLAGLRRPPRHLLNASRYATTAAVQATRGCPHGCRFCAISAFCGGRQRQRPVADVVAEVAALPQRFLVFVDDNLTADPDYARELFAGLAGLGKRWVTQASLAMARDERLLTAAAGAGCLGIFAGLETFTPGNLVGVGKDCHRVAEYRDAVGTLHAHGIGVEAGLVFGFDGDTPDVFRATLDTVEHLGIDAVQVSILTPLPGTPLATDYTGRIFDRDWRNYDFHHVVFQPRGMTAAQLQAGHDWVTREFYRPWRIARRLARFATRPRGLANVAYPAILNAAYWGRTRSWGVRGRDPGAAVRRQDSSAAAAPSSARMMSSKLCSPSRSR